MHLNLLNIKQDDNDTNVSTNKFDNMNIKINSTNNL